MTDEELRSRVQQLEFAERRRKDNQQLLAMTGLVALVVILARRTQRR